VKTARIAFGILSAALMCGCGKRDVPKYDRVPSRAVAALYDAVEQEGSELALEKLEDLSSLMPDAELVFYLQRELQDNISLDAANVALAKDDFEKARTQLIDALTTDGASDRLETALSQVEGLIAIQTYLDFIPYDDAASAAAAVSKLPPTEIFESAEYSTWLRDQTVVVAELVRRERLRLKEELIAEIDLQMSRDVQALPIALVQYAAIDVDSKMVELWHQSRDGSLPLTALADVADEQWGDFVTYNLYVTGDAGLRQLIAVYVRDRVPSTYIGQQLKIHLAFMDRRDADGFLMMQALLRQIPELDTAPIIATLNNTFFAADVTAPSVPGFLQQIRQLEASLDQL
jgi:hypothetical protein